MRILVLNGSPRPKGNTKQMVDAFREGAKSAGHRVDVIDVCKKKIAGCLACEHCHTKGNGACVQKDDMQEVYSLLGEADMLVIASPIYYHGISGQLKCTLDRFYSAAYPRKPRNLKKVAMILSSGDPAMYDGAMFSYKGDFVEYLDLEDMGVFTAYGMENGSASKLKELRDFGRNGRVLHGCVIHLRIHVDSLYLQILMPDQHIYQQERAAISTAAPSCWLLFRNIVRASPNVNLNTTIF